MNLTLKGVYYCYNSNGKWGKGLTPAKAKVSCGIVSLKPSCEFILMAALFDNPNEAELKNLHDCITADHMTGAPNYYKDNRTKEDTDMINKYHVGWITIEHYEPKPNKSVRGHN